jgi:hypothetical protein
MIEMMGMPMYGRRVHLEPVRWDHAQSLCRLAHSDELVNGWPLFGNRRSSADFEKMLWSTSSLLFAILSRETGEVIGLVQGHDQDQIGRTIGLGLLITNSLWRAGWPLEAPVIFLEFVFVGLNYRKVYLATSQSLMSRLCGLLGTTILHEASHREHLKTSTGYEDLHILALHRDSWDRELASQVLGTSRSVAAIHQPRRR